jgi:hypothetical protein
MAEENSNADESAKPEQVELANASVPQDTPKAAVKTYMLALGSRVPQQLNVEIVKLRTQQVAAVQQQSEPKLEAAPVPKPVEPIQGESQ